MRPSRAGRAEMDEKEVIVTLTFDSFHDAIAVETILRRCGHWTRIEALSGQGTKVQFAVAECDTVVLAENEW